MTTLAVSAAVEPAFALLGQLVNESGDTWISVAKNWQIDDALAVLDPAHSQKLHFLTRPRGGSKTSDLAAIAIAWLLTQAPPAASGYVVASDLEQGAELIDALAGMLARTPGLSGALVVESTRVVNPIGGASMNVLAADGPGAYGKRPHLTIVDEFAQWNDTKNAKKVWSAVASAVPKVPGGRMVILTTAGDPAHFSYKVLEGAKADPEHWRVHELPGPLDWRTEDDLSVQRSLLPAWEFDRLHLNRWVAADDSLVDLDKLRACVVLDGPQPWTWHHQYCVSVDLATRRDNCVVAVTHAEATGFGARRVVLDRMVVWTPLRDAPVSLEDVEETIASLAWEYAGNEHLHAHNAQVVFDPAEGRLMMDRLRTRGIHVTQFNFTVASVGKLGSLLHQLLRDELLALPDDEALLDELAHIRLRETSIGGVRIDHDSGRHDDRAIAIALGAQHLLDPFGPVQPILVSSWTDAPGRYDNDPAAFPGELVSALDLDW